MSQSDVEGVPLENDLLQSECESFRTCSDHRDHENSQDDLTDHDHDQEEDIELLVPSSSDSSPEYLDRDDSLSPMADLNRHDRSSMDLSDEAVEDLANNNDPNNNAASGGEPPMQDHNLMHRAEPESHDSSEDNNEESEENSGADIDHDQLLSDIKLIRHFMPKRSADEIYHYLESHFHDPARVQVVLNEFIEQERAQEEDEVPIFAAEETNPVKNKSGNGLKVKNSKTTAAEASTSEQGPSSAATTAPSAEIEGEDELNPETKRRRLSPASSSTSSGKLPVHRPKLELKEQWMHGPFNFKDHRPETRRSVEIQEGCDKVEPEVTTLNSPGTNDSAKKSPELVEIGSPPMVDITQVDQNEKDALLSRLIAMFPAAPLDFLMEGVQEIAGSDVAIERFISGLLERNSQPPQDWKQLKTIQEEVQKEASQVQEEEPVAGPSSSKDAQDAETETEDEVDRQFKTIQNIFPDTDPEYLYGIVTEHKDNPQALSAWIENTLETNAQNLPKRSDYEKRVQETKLHEKFTADISVEELLEMYEDPVRHFSDINRKVSNVYKKHALQQLKKDFRLLSSSAISSALYTNKGLFYPTYKYLKAKEFKSRHGTRKTRRPDHECARPSEIDLEFLEEYQFVRKEAELLKYVEDMKVSRENKLREAKEAQALVECKACFDDECLPEEILPCKNGHDFCFDCIRRASEVAIGDGKTKLMCMGGCDDVPFELAALQRVLNVKVFNKWLKKIQLAEVQEAQVEGLENCPFCEFATIMDTSPEENKVFKCQNPECGKETCRLCGELSHIPQRCEEVEKDAEVKKRTYIENKMTEAVMRKCLKCQKPFLKLDGCNLITCDCGAKMCYLCRKPVNDYSHFYGQGAAPTTTKTCPLWTNNDSVHTADVERGAREAKEEMDQVKPDIQLKHDPTKEVLERAGSYKAPTQHFHLNQDHDPLRGMFGNPLERHRFMQQQQAIEDEIRRQRGGLIGNPPHNDRQRAQFPHGVPARARPVAVGPVNNLLDYPVHDRLMHRMGEWLQLREAQRQRHRAMRRREMHIMEDFQLMYHPPDAPNVNFPHPIQPMPHHPPLAHQQPVQQAQQLVAGQPQQPHDHRYHLPAHQVQPQVVPNIYAQARPPVQLGPPAQVAPQFHPPAQYVHGPRAVRGAARPFPNARRRRAVQHQPEGRQVGAQANPDPAPAVHRAVDAAAPRQHPPAVQQQDRTRALWDHVVDDGALDTILDDLEHMT